MTPSTIPGSTGPDPKPMSDITTAGPDGDNGHPSPDHHAGIGGVSDLIDGGTEVTRT